MDRVDLAVGSLIGDLLAVGRVGRVDVVRVVVGELGLATPVGVEGVDLVVFPAVLVRVGYPAVFARLPCACWSGKRLDLPAALVSLLLSHHHWGGRLVGRRLEETCPTHAHRDEHHRNYRSHRASENDR